MTLLGLRALCGRNPPHSSSNSSSTDLLYFSLSIPLSMDLHMSENVWNCYGTEAGQYGKLGMNFMSLSPDNIVSIECST